MDPIRKLIDRKIAENGLDYKDVSRALGKNHAYMQQYIKRGIPAKLKEDDRRKLAGILKVDEADLGAPPAPINSRTKTNLIDEIDLVDAPTGSDPDTLEKINEININANEQAALNHWLLPEWVLSRMGAPASHIKAFPVRGDSMEPTIRDGDVVFIDTRHQVPSPPGIYALIDVLGGIAIKRLEVTSRTNEEPVTVRVTSDNPHHMDREVSLSEIKIIGRYTGRFTI